MNIRKKGDVVSQKKPSSEKVNPLLGVEIEGPLAPYSSVPPHSFKYISCLDLIFFRSMAQKQPNKSDHCDPTVMFVCFVWLKLL